MGPNWNKIADTYDKLVFCELDDTKRYLDVIGLAGGESVLDVCCGPGRISVLAAERGCSVVGIDSAEKMLEHARANAESRGVADKCDFRLLNWEKVLPGQNVEAADVVIASRCGAMMDVGKLSSLARQKVAVQIFADAPSIPQLKGVLFDGCGKPGGPKGPGFGPDAGGPGAERGKGDREGGAPDEARMPNGPVNGPGGMPGGPMPMGGPGGPGMPPMPGGPMGGPGGPMGGPGGPGGMRHVWPPKDSGYRAGSAYLDLILKVYAAGYDPNVRIMPERFIKDFASESEAVKWVCSLEPKRAEGHEDRVAANVAPFLSAANGGGVRFCIATAAAIIWWDVRGRASQLAASAPDWR